MTYLNSNKIFSFLSSFPLKDKSLLKVLISLTESLPVDKNFKFSMISYAIVTCKIIIFGTLNVIFTPLYSKSLEKIEFDGSLVKVTVSLWTVILLCEVCYHYIVQCHRIILIMTNAFRLLEFWRIEKPIGNHIFIIQYIVFVILSIIMACVTVVKVGGLNIFYALIFSVSFYNVLKQNLIQILYGISINIFSVFVDFVNDKFYRCYDRQMKSLFLSIIDLERFITSINDAFSVQMFFGSITAFFSSLTNFFLFYTLLINKTRGNELNNDGNGKSTMIYLIHNMDYVLWMIQNLYVIWKMFTNPFKAEMQVRSSFHV